MCSVALNKIGSEELTQCINHISMYLASSNSRAAIKLKECVHICSRSVPAYVTGRASGTASTLQEAMVHDLQIRRSRLG